MSKEIIKNGWHLTFSGTRGEVYLYQIGGNDWQFVGRFKHGKASASANHFAKFLVNNFTPAEFFELAKTMAPAYVLQTKGYVSYNTLRLQKMIKENHPLIQRYGQELLAAN